MAAHNSTANPRPTFLAVDFGGGSGRVMAGTLVDGKVQLSEVHRFGNRQVLLSGVLYWDFLSLYADMLEGLRRAAAMGLNVVSIGIDTWGVDFGLIDSRGMLLANPVCYRDVHTAGLSAQWLEQHGAEAHFAVAGLQTMDINTAWRLLWLAREHRQLLDAAHRLLFMPDLFSHVLTGTANNEYTIASTSELLNATTRQWNWQLIDVLGVPRHLFGDIVMPGTSRGTLLPEVADASGLSPDVKVIAVGSHDTASAVMSSGASYDLRREAFLSSGTWSLLGVALGTPILTEQARLAGFSNEGGNGPSIKFLQNITGLWMMQRLASQWQAQGLDSDYGLLTQMAEEAVTDAIVDVDDHIFASADTDMCQAIAQYCRDRGITPPQGQGETVRCVLQSLAQRYRKGVELLNTLLPEPVERLCIVGGGVRNALLTRLTAEATGLEVTVGPAEATAIGNIITQCQAMGYQVESHDALS